MRTQTLRMRAGEQRRGFDDIAVDQSDRAGVLHAADGVEQQRAVDAIHRDPDVRRSKATHGELGAEVVAGGNAGKDLHGPEGIVGHESPEGEEIAAAQHELTGNTRLRLAECRARDGDVFDVSARPFRHRNPDVHGFAGGDRHLPSHQPESNHGDEHDLWSGGNADDLETAVGVRERLLARRLDFHEHRRERHAGPGFDDGAGDTAGPRLGGGVEREKQQYGEDGD